MNQETENLTSLIPERPLSIPERYALLKSVGLEFDQSKRIWKDSDGRGIGDGVMRALCDEAFMNYIQRIRSEKNLICPLTSNETEKGKETKTYETKTSTQ